MKILFRTRRLPGVIDAQIVALRLQEAAAVWKLVAAGTLREIWFSPDGPAVFGMLECEGLEQARAVLQALPMPAAGLIDFDFHRLLPYDQFGLLFREEFR
jgi:muconolactone delta-isomerase